MRSRREVLKTVATGLGGSALILGTGMSIAEAQNSGEYFGFVDYSHRDYEVVDYQLFSLPGIDGLKFRGPAPDLTPGGYFTCVGASQALGVLIEKPFPQLLSERLDLPVLNMGLGGVSPSFFADHDGLIDYMNKGRFVVLQVMTARTEQNSRLQPTQRIEVLRDTVRGDTLNSILAWDRIFEDDRESLPLHVAESRANWVAANLRLLYKIKVPVFLFWFSPRREEETLNYQASRGSEVIGDFPQLVDQSSLDIVREFCDDYYACYSDRNRSFPFVNRFTGEPVVVDYDLTGRGSMDVRLTTNRYYASQEMNEDAVEGLLAMASKAM